MAAEFGGDQTSEQSALTDSNSQQSVRQDPSRRVFQWPGSPPGLERFRTEQKFRQKVYTETMHVKRTVGR